MKKQRIKKNIKQYSGITLISLVITIIILIILAGVTLSIVLGENGLLAKARKGAEDYQYAGIKERVESEILALDIEKVTKGEKLTIQDALIGLKEKGTFEEIDIESNSGVCEGYVVELGYNENDKVVIKGIEKDTGVRIVATINPTGYTNQKVEVTISVKGNEKNVTSIEVPVEMTKKEGTEGIYEVEANGTYHVKATLEDGTSIEKDIVIATIDKLSPNAFEITAENTGTGIKISGDTTTDANADDDNVQSGMDRYEYYVKKSTEADSAYQKYETNEIEGLEVGKYNVYVIAYDKAGNSKESNKIEVEVKLKLKFQQVSAGEMHSLAIDIDGNLWAWGYGGSGQIGDGTTEQRTTPVQITISTKPDIKFKQIAAGGWHSLAIDIDGNLWAWGLNDYGQLGDGTTENRTSPVQIIISTKPDIKFNQISAGRRHSLAIDIEGNLWVWGNNNNSCIVGNGATESKVKTPMKVSISSNPDIKFNKISAGYDHNLVIDTEGNLWAWGENNEGQLGDGTTERRSSIPIQIKKGNTFKEITAKVDNAYAIDTEGNLWAWGDNSYGQIEDGTNIGKNVPQKIIIKDHAIKQIASGWDYISAIDTEGNLWTWGYNKYGQLGDGTTENRTSPVQITISEKQDLKFKQISSNQHSLAIDTNGYLWAWGSNDRGQLGDGTTEDKSIPTPIAQ